jgi:GABA permease
MDPQTPSDGTTPRRILVVANQTACGDELLGVIEARMRQGPCRFTLLVPATHTSEHGTWTEGSDRAVARQRMTEAMERFRGIGADLADGMVGDANPVRAIDDALIEQPHDEIILSTLPPGASRWLKLDLPRRVEQRFALPVTTVISQRQLTS